MWQAGVLTKTYTGARKGSLVCLHLRVPCDVCASGRVNGYSERAILLKVSLDEAADVCQQRDGELIALDDALKELALFDERKGRIVELRYFGGLSVEETAQVLEVSPVTVKREWRAARLWLLRAMSGEVEN